MKRSLPNLRILTATLALALVASSAAAALDANVVALGEALYMDMNLSLNRNQACNTCHDALPAVTGFVDPDNVANGTPVSAGSVNGLFGGRNAPAAGYAAFSPAFHWNAVDGLYVGGQFWDGRETNLAGQAAGPFLNPVEMAMPDKWSVVDRLRTSTRYGGPDYSTLFDLAFPEEELGRTLKFILPYPIRSVRIGCDFTIKKAENLASLGPVPGVVELYEFMARAIGEFEKSRLFNKFNSRYDYSLVGWDTLTAEEAFGLDLFLNKGQCDLCHLSGTALAPDGSALPPLFTDFTYDNLGIPVNPAVAALAGLQAIDLGLGGRPDIAERDPSGLQQGKFKVMSLRNIELTPPYGHNGFFATLGEIVHFYNTRDVDPTWPAPEVPATVNTTELGNLALTPAEEAALVAFMLTLTDRDPVVFPSPYFPNYDPVTPIPMP